jgi:hypothetical protein
MDWHTDDMNINISISPAVVREYYDGLARVEEAKHGIKSSRQRSDRTLDRTLDRRSDRKSYTRRTTRRPIKEERWSPPRRPIRRPIGEERTQRVSKVRKVKQEQNTQSSFDWGKLADIFITTVLPICSSYVASQYFPSTSKSPVDSVRDFCKPVPSENTEKPTTDTEEPANRSKCPFMNSNEPCINKCPFLHTKSTGTECPLSDNDKHTMNAFTDLLTGDGLNDQNIKETVEQFGKDHGLHVKVFDLNDLGKESMNKEIDEFFSFLKTPIAETTHEEKVEVPEVKKTEVTTPEVPEKESPKPEVIPPQQNLKPESKRYRPAYQEDDVCCSTDTNTCSSTSKPNPAQINPLGNMMKMMQPFLQGIMDTPVVSHQGQNNESQVSLGDFIQNFNLNNFVTIPVPETKTPCNTNTEDHRNPVDEILVDEDFLADEDFYENKRRIPYHSGEEDESSVELEEENPEDIAEIILEDPTDVIVEDDDGSID